VLNLVGMGAEVGAMRARAWIGSSSAPPRSDRIQPDWPWLLLLMIRPARPTLAEVPLADLSSRIGFTSLWCGLIWRTRQ